MEGKLLGINKANAICDIIGAVLTAMSSFFIFDLDLLYFSYLVVAVFVALNIYGLIKQKKSNGKIVGNVLSIIGGGIFLFIGIFGSLPAMVLYILASVFSFKNKVIE